MKPRPWTVQKHGELEQLEPNLWRVEGIVPGIPMRRVMAIAKLADGGLVIHSAIALNEAEMAKLDALGPVKFIVVPNGYHRLDCRAYAARYPQAHVLAPPGAKTRVAQAAPQVGDLSELSDPDVKLTTVAGTRDGEVLMIVTSGDRTSLVFTDTVFNMPHGHGLKGFVLQHLTQSSGGPKVSRLARWFIIKDKPAFAAQLDALAAQQPVRVLVAHHEMITIDPAGCLRTIAASVR
ncbi:hypothetical protein BH11MYX1_BH11MYX1_12540 [soil metagenome]